MRRHPGLQAQLRRPQGRPAAGLHRRRDARRSGARSQRCWPSSPRTRASAPRPTWPGARRRRRRPTLPLRPVVVGFGPCGIFAALMLAQMGFKPIVLERGKTVRERTEDTWGLWRKSVLNPESNVQFGEGGAGTFSDGKLYSQIKDPRFLGRKVMDGVRQGRRAGGDPLRRASAHRHLPAGEDGREHARADRRAGRRNPLRAARDRRADRGRPASAARPHGARPAHRRASELRADHVVLAVGHSARDTFEMLHERGVYIEAKPFSIGFRIEHPQGLIDRARWGRHAGHPLLGAADYKLVHHARNGRSVYSFCMCPGGTVVAATSRAGPRRHQRHEPVFAQRAQRQRRHRGGHRPARLSRATIPLRRASSCSAQLESQRLRARRRRLRRAGPAGRRLHRRQAVDRARQRRCPPTSRA